MAAIPGEEPASLFGACVSIIDTVFEYGALNVVWCEGVCHVKGYRQ